MLAGDPHGDSVFQGHGEDPRHSLAERRLGFDPAKPLAGPGLDPVSFAQLFHLDAIDQGATEQASVAPKEDVVELLGFQEAKLLAGPFAVGIGADAMISERVGEFWCRMELTREVQELTAAVAVPELAERGYFLGVGFQPAARLPP